MLDLPELPDNLQALPDKALFDLARVYQVKARVVFHGSDGDHTERLLGEVYRRAPWMSELAAAAMRLLEEDMGAADAFVTLEFDRSPATLAVEARLDAALGEWMAAHGDQSALWELAEGHYSAARVAWHGAEIRQADREQRSRISAAVNHGGLSEKEAATLAKVDRGTVRRLLGKSR